jgi:hypothetical protein
MPRPSLLFRAGLTARRMRAPRASMVGPPIDRRVTIKGEAGDEACLCTSTQTFLMRLAESSNTHYLVRGAIGSSDQPGVEICASVGAYFELKASVPRVIKLRTLLAKRVFDGFGASDGDAGEDAHSAKRLTTPGLRAIIQCSDAELTTSLDALHAVELGGEWRMLSTRYQHDITEAILLLVIQHGWSHAHLCVRDVVRAAVDECADFEAQAVYHCLSHVTLEPLPLAEASAVSGELTCALDPRKVSVFHAESVLRKGALLPTDAFVKEWETRTADLELAEPISLKMLGVRAQARPAACADGTFGARARADRVPTCSRRPRLRAARPVCLARIARLRASRWR